MKQILFYVLCVLCVQNSYAQEKLGYQAFINKVKENNIAYAAEKLNIGIAEAELRATKIFNDPTLSVEYADNDDRRMLMGRSVGIELSKTFQLGVRSANIDLAHSEKQLADALLTDYFHNLRTEATLAYINAQRLNELARIKQITYDNIRRLADSDSIRFALGEITQVDATQSALEAGMLYNELLQAQADALNACHDLSLMTGYDSIYVIPNDDLHAEVRLFDTHNLIQTALDNRADLAAALKNVDVAAKQLKVTRRQRNPEFDLAIGYNYNTEVRNEIAPAPQFNGVTVGISVPLKLSNTNKGAVRAAEHRVRQAELNYRQAELEIRNSVMQSYAQYNALLRQVRTYDSGLLHQAQKVLDGKTYSYRRGETSLLEVLNAQRTYDDVRATYIETLAACNSALATLLRAAAISE
ncbi:MAG: TolC family protein [Tannerella sp.]|jgi:cobalt-zinc-cadmium efflux system outer membrane protein|nr:TolC family protein [Tannerella sp.]